jgi:hypothetical protein
MKKEYAEQARKQEALIGKGKARFRELDDKIQAVNGEIAELTMAE